MIPSLNNNDNNNNNELPGNLVRWPTFQGSVVFFIRCTYFNNFHLTTDLTYSFELKWNFAWLAGNKLS